MATTVSITVSAIDGDVKRHLSVIGKRLYDKEGKNLFSNITVSSAEDPIFKYYYDTAAQMIVAAVSQFVTAYSNSDSAISFTVNHPRWANISAAFQGAAKSCITLHAVGEYLGMTHADLAKKYYDDARSQLDTIIMLMYHKDTPT